MKYSPYIHPSVMFCREILQLENGYSEAEAARRCEDYELFMRLHAHGHRGYNIQEPLIMYRENEESYYRRNLKSRIQEAGIRFQGFRKLGILNTGAFPYLVRPVAAGVVPAKVLQSVRANRTGRDYSGRQNSGRQNSGRKKHRQVETV